MRQRKRLFNLRREAEAAFINLSKRTWALEAATDAMLKNEVIWLTRNDLRAGLVRPTQHDGGYVIVAHTQESGLNYRVLPTNDWLEAILAGSHYDNPDAVMVELRELARAVIAERAKRVAAEVADLVEVAA